MQSMIFASHLLLLFDRPNEPIFLPRGENNTVLEVPIDYLPEKYQSNAGELYDEAKKLSNHTLRIRRTRIPDLTLPMKILKQQTYSLSQHEDSVNPMITYFMESPTMEDLMSLACYCRDRLNQQLFYNALSVAILHRPDTKHLRLPQYYESFPSTLLENSVFGKAREQLALYPNGPLTPIEIPMDYASSNENPDHPLAFFREDVGANIFHWYWHLLYPIGGPKAAYDKDRRGEMFYWMHHQIMARYHAERLANGMGLTKALDNLREPIPEAYWPKLDRSTTGRSWPGRSANMTLSDVNRSWDNFHLPLSTIELWKRRVHTAIRAKRFQHRNGKMVYLNETHGTEIIGNTLDANLNGPNKDFYGYVHGSGHVTTSFIHDPQGHHRELAGIMNPTSTALRDPVFYRWHEYIDDVFYSFIDTLPPHPREELVFRNIKIQSVGVITPGARPNILNTHWTKSDINIERGLDYAPRRPIYARVQHLNHDEFSYNIIVDNSKKSKVKATVRIFLIPKLGPNGQPLSFFEAKRLAIEMDKFGVELKEGLNRIQRSSAISPVSVPYETIFVDAPNQQTRPEYCGCGWPHYMMVPKGTPEGYPMDLFVMISDYESERIKQKIPQGCTNGHTMCGLKADLKFPDRRPMGYPFDRVGAENVPTLKYFLTPNMGVQTVTIKFQDIVKPHKSNLAHVQKPYDDGNDVHHIAVPFEFGTD